MPTTPAVTSLLARLARLRARIRGLSFLGGLGRIVLWAAILLTASFLADWLLDLPLPVRRLCGSALDRPDELASSVDRRAAASGSASRHVVPQTWASHGFAFPSGHRRLAWLAARHLARPRHVSRVARASVEERHRRLNDRLAASRFRPRASARRAARARR
jgi:membrane-associated phospholipid phosphatase